ncbi:hypothetical protein CLIM01_14337 [Colletotrichum limetticola]|uniref:Uncharacterized protein n=1 Tax=Colletotrichum limetticola TaxID=1209924 RepID=A0ABQ9P9H1_9PEZI|nr:hypothetical protein CLIM01_14337 [Colletotrichum limetticola]
MESTDEMMIPQELEGEDGINHEEDDDVFSLVTEDNWAADKYRMAPLVAFLRGATLLQLQRGDIDAPNADLAILIDGKFSDNQVHSRPYLGSLSATGLLEELQKQRYTESLRDKEDDCMEDELVDAERRLIYIVDLNRWSALALVGTAPESLYRHLPDFLLNYIVSKPSIGIHFPTEGPETFSLEFSLPYYVWRTSKTLMQDHRAIGSEEETGSLRSSQDVTFLRNLAGCDAEREDVDVVYSSHMSCIVTGYDQSRWTCILLCESWFEAEVINWPTPDSIARYEDEQQDLQNAFGKVQLLDPMCRGKSDVFAATPAQWLPRSYFVRVLAVRVWQIHQELSSVYFNMNKHIRGIIKQHQRLLRRLQRIARGVEIAARWDDVLNELEDFEENILNAKVLVKSISQTLEGIVSSSNLFLSTDVNYLLYTEGRSGEMSANIYPYLSQVRRIFNDLRQLCMRFADFQTQFEMMAENGKDSRHKALLRLKLHEAREAQLSPPPTLESVPVSTVPQDSLVVSIASWMTIISQPMVNVAAVFGYDQILSLSGTPGNFVISLVVVCLVMTAIILICVGLATRKRSYYELCLELNDRIGRSVQRRQHGFFRS